MVPGSRQGPYWDTHPSARWQYAPPQTSKVDGSSPRHRGQSQAGSDLPSGAAPIILTVLKRSVAGWVDEAMGR